MTFPSLLLNFVVALIVVFFCNRGTLPRRLGGNPYRPLIFMAIYLVCLLIVRPLLGLAQSARDAGLLALAVVLAAGLFYLYLAFFRWPGATAAPGEEAAIIDDAAESASETSDDAR